MFEITQHFGDHAVDVPSRPLIQKDIAQGCYALSERSMRTFTNSSNATRSAVESFAVGSERAANFSAAWFKPGSAASASPARTMSFVVSSWSSIAS